MIVPAPEKGFDYLPAADGFLDPLRTDAERPDAGTRRCHPVRA